MNAPIRNTEGRTAVPPPLPTQGSGPSSDGARAGKKGFPHRYGPRLTVTAACAAAVAMIINAYVMQLLIG